MKINWKVKSMIFFFVDRLRLERFHQWCSKNLPLRPHRYFYQIDQNWVTHESEIETKNAKVIFEFGGGKHLGQNLYLSMLGLKQIVIDIQPIIDFRMLNRVWRNILSIRQSTQVPQSINSVEALEATGITYIAPADASNIGLESGSIDAIVSTNTFEHISLNGLKRILSECRRILRDDGIISAIIDYRERHQHTDPDIRPLNFLKFSVEDWKKYSHECHFQNCIRHEEYEEIFKEARFVIEKQRILDGFSEISPAIRNSSFYRTQESNALRGHFVLQKQSSSTATNFW